MLVNRLEISLADGGEQPRRFRHSLVASATQGSRFPRLVLFSGSCFSDCRRRVFAFDCRECLGLGLFRLWRNARFCLLALEPARFCQKYHLTLKESVQPTLSAVERAISRGI